MSGFVGADVEQLDALAVRLDRQAAAYREIASSSSLALMVATWTGTDIDRVRAEWNRQCKPAILKVAGELSSLAIDVKRQAAHQRATSAATGGRTSARTPFASTTKDLVIAVRDARDKDTVKITEVVGEDGVTRYVVLIDGTHGKLTEADGWLNAHGWGDAVLGGMDKDTRAKLYVEQRLLEAMKHHPKAEIMMVGYSQGGDIAQGIANDHRFNVKEILTIGSPPVMTTDHYGGANVVRLDHNSDEVLNIVEGARVGTVLSTAIPIVGMFTGEAATNSVMTALTSGDTADGSILTFKGGSDSESGGAHDIGHKDEGTYHGHYEYLATSYDESTDPEVVAARERQSVFLKSTPVASK